MRILITGACGFVGRHLVSELSAAGHIVLAADLHAEPPAPPLTDGVEYRACNLLDGSAAGALLEHCRPDAVCHLAAQSSAGHSFTDPKGTFDANLYGTLNLLEAVRRRREEDGGGKVRILSIGSSEEYGRRSPDEMPLGEKSPIEPVSPYAVSKAAQGMLALQYWRSHGIQCILTRSFSHTGPGQPDRFVLPSFARQCAEIAAGSREPVLRVGNLDVVRDFLDVRDVVRAYRLLIEHGMAGQVYNVCSGKGLALSDALDRMIGAVPANVVVERDPARFRPADVPVMIGDNGKLRASIEWRPLIDTERMLTDLMKYWERVVGDMAADGTKT